MAHISVEKFETVLAGMNGIFLDAGEKKVYLEGNPRGDVYWEWHVEFIQPDGQLVQFVIPMMESLQKHIFPDVPPFYSFQMSLWISGGLLSIKSRVYHNLDPQCAKGWPV